MLPKIFSISKFSTAFNSFAHDDSNKLKIFEKEDMFI